MSRLVIIQVTLSGIAYLIVFFTGYWWFTRWFRRRDVSRRDRLKGYVAKHPEILDGESAPPSDRSGSD